MRFRNDSVKQCPQRSLGDFCVSVSNLFDSLFNAVESGKKPSVFRKVLDTPNKNKRHKPGFSGVCGLWADSINERFADRLEWVGTHTCMSMFDIRRVYGGENPM